MINLLILLSVVGGWFNMRNGGCTVECRTVKRLGCGSFHTLFETKMISFSAHCLCLLEETLEAVGQFYLVSVPGEIKDPTQGVNV